MRLSILCLAFLMACNTTEEETMTENTANAATSCGAEGMQRLVGQPEEVLAKMRLKPPVRILKPGMAVTQDHRPDRLNIVLDETGTIIRLYCG